MSTRENNIPNLNRLTINDLYYSSFDITLFQRFISVFFKQAELLPAVYQSDMSEDYTDYKDCIHSFAEVASYIDEAGKVLILMTVELKNNNRIETKGNVERQFISQWLERNGYDAALVAFYSSKETDWRLSLIRFSKSSIQNISTNIKVVQRASYIIGKDEPSYLLETQLLPILKGPKPSLKEIEEGFNVNSVLKRFSKQYEKHYFKLKAYLENDMAFKRQMKSSNMSLDQLSELFAKHTLSQIAFLYFLQKKGWLGVEIKKAWGSGDKAFIRNLFNESKKLNRDFLKDYLEPLIYEGLSRKRKNNNFHRFNCKIPFLNQRIFKPIDAYQWKEASFSIPNEMFSNKGESGKGSEGILDFFDQFNFTLKEEESLDREVAVDPEMLGKVFENLLGDQDRKSHGVYYTSREIVHYMSHESLVHYLAESTGLLFQDIKEFIDLKELTVNEPTLNNVELIDEALINIKVIDPAVGSGAFPLGMLSDIVKLRKKTSHLLAKKKSISTYQIKLNIIQNSIFAVDIDFNAVEITKLRLWLSLIVEQEGNENGLQPMPLPNLDKNIVVGNSLIGGNKGINWPTSFSEIFKEKGGFDIVIGNPPYVGDRGNKAIFRPIKATGFGKKFYQGQMDLFYFFFHLALDIGKENAIITFITTNYFLTAAGARKLRKDLKERSSIIKLINFNELKLFGSAQGQHNLITMLINNQNQALLSYNTLTKRKGIVEVDILNSILMGTDTKSDYYQVKQQEIFEGEELYIRLNGASSQLSKDPINKILSKVKNDKNSQALGDICTINAGVGVTVSKITPKYIKEFPELSLKKGEGVFVINKDVAIHLEQSIIKDFVKNSNINHYSYLLNKDKLIYLTWQDNINLYPITKKHLLKFKKILDNQIERYEEIFPWFALNRPRSPEIFDSLEKIIVPYRAKANYFAYSNEPVYGSRDVLFIRNNSSIINTKYLLALLNSKLYYMWLYMKGKRKGDVLELYAKPLMEIPTKIISSKEQKPFIERVDQMLNLLKEKNGIWKYREQIERLQEEIDYLVYKLYKLDRNEIEIVEKLSQIRET